MSLLLSHDAKLSTDTSHTYFKRIKNVYNTDEYDNKNLGSHLFVQTPFNFRTLIFNHFWPNVGCFYFWFRFKANKSTAHLYL